ncbi:DNA primase, partial [Peptoniphilus grossensis]
EKIVDELIKTLERNYLQKEKERILENIDKLQGEEDKNLLLDAWRRHDWTRSSNHKPSRERGQSPSSK